MILYICIYIYETGSKSDCKKMYKYEKVQDLKRMILFIF